MCSVEIPITDLKKNYGDKQTLKGMIRVFSRSLTVRQTHIEKTRRMLNPAGLSLSTFNSVQ